MMRIISILLILGCLMVANQLFSQDNKNIKGSVIDTLEQHVISEASVVILNARDSFMVASMRTNKNGLFEFNNIQEGNYILLITYPHYAAYADTFSVYNNTSTVDLKNINLQLKAVLLKEIIVGTKNSAIRLKGDTTEFDQPY